jgi:hypothetical protein
MLPSQIVEQNGLFSTLNGMPLGKSCDPSSLPKGCTFQRQRISTQGNDILIHMPHCLNCLTDSHGWKRCFIIVLLYVLVRLNHVDNSETDSGINSPKSLKKQEIYFALLMLKYDRPKAKTHNVTIWQAIELDIFTFLLHWGVMFSHD